MADCPELGDDERTVGAILNSKNKQIASIGIYDETLLFVFDDNTTLTIFDDGQSCCEHRYMHTDDKLDDFIGATFQGAEVRDGPTEGIEYEPMKESQFLIITTSKGQFTVVNYNEHNGYYGGFSIVARLGAVTTQLRAKGQRDYFYLHELFTTEEL